MAQLHREESNLTLPHLNNLHFRDQKLFVWWQTALLDLQQMQDDGESPHVVLAFVQELRRNAWAKLQLALNIEDKTDLESIITAASANRDMFYLYWVSGKSRGELITRICKDKLRWQLDDLLMIGADPNTRDSEGCPVIFHCASEAHENLLYLLIEYGADVNAVFDGKSVLDSLRHNYFYDGLLALLDAGADVNQTEQCFLSFMLQAEPNDRDADIKLLLRHGADVNRKNNDTGDTPLHVAVNNHSNKGVPSKYVKWLLNAGADIDCKNFDGLSPLACAIRLAEKQPDVGEAVVRQLIQRGANADGCKLNQGQRQLLEMREAAKPLSGEQTAFQLLPRALWLKTINYVDPVGTAMLGRVSKDLRTLTRNPLTRKQFIRRFQWLWRIEFQDTDLQAWWKSVRAPFEEEFKRLRDITELKPSVQEKLEKRAEAIYQAANDRLFLIYTAEKSTNEELTCIDLINSNIDIFYLALLGGYELDARFYAEHIDPDDGLLDAALESGFGDGSISDLIAAYMARPNPIYQQSMQDAFFYIDPLVVDLLLANGAQPDSDVLIFYLESCRVGLAEKIYPYANLADLNDAGQTVLHHFSQCNCEFRIFRWVVNKYNDFEQRSVSGDTALLIAARQGASRKVRLLLEKGADPSAINSQTGNSALQHALLAGDSETVNLLATVCPELLIRENKYGKTPLQMAADLGQFRLALWIMSQSEGSQQPDCANFLQQIQQAIANNPKLQEKLKGIVEAIDGLAPVNINTIIRVQLQIQRFLFEEFNLAPRQYYTHCSTEFFNKRGDDELDQDKRGLLQLMWLAGINRCDLLFFMCQFNHNSRSMPHISILTWMIQEGADVNWVGVNFVTLLLTRHYVEHKHLLIDQGADIHYIGPFGRHALHDTHNKKLVGRLVDAELGVNLVCTKGESPLIKLAGHEGRGITKAKACLLKAGADVNLQTAEGLTALHTAANLLLPFEVKFWLNSGACPNIEDVNGRTPIFFAAFGAIRGQLRNMEQLCNVIEHLVSHGAKLEHRDHYGVSIAQILPDDVYSAVNDRVTQSKHMDLEQYK